MYARAFLVAVSRDHGAAEDSARWSAEARRAAPWQRARRRQAEHHAAEAEQRAGEAGIDFAPLPRPRAGLRAPDRAARQRLGRRMPPPGSPVPGSFGVLSRRRSAQPSGPPASQSVMPDGGGVGAL